MSNGNRCREKAGISRFALMGEAKSKKITKGS